MAFKNQAIGVWEASCIMGVHWTTVSRMVEKGMIEARELRSDADSDRVFRIYSLEQCERNYQEYLEVCRKNGGHAPKHPRTQVHMRHEALDRLQKEPVKIDFNDAISAVEAAEILGVCATFPARLGASGKIVRRSLWSNRPDSQSSRGVIYSRRDCEKNRAIASALTEAGIKIGRPRSGIT